MLSATRKWIFLKVSSLLMVPFMIWFLIKFVSIYDGNYQIIVEFFSTQPSAIFFSIFKTLSSIKLKACMVPIAELNLSFHKLSLENKFEFLSL